MLNDVLDGGDNESAHEQSLKAGWIMRLRSSGVLDHEVLKALEAVPRRKFLTNAQQQFLYEDRAFPIDCGQMGTAPSLIGQIATFLQLDRTHNMLEIGTGSGYQTAVLSWIGGQILSIERFRRLSELAKDRIQACRITNVDIVHSDGLSLTSYDDENGDSFDRILLNGSVERVPSFLFDLLSDDGRLIAPVRDAEGQDHLMQYDRIGARIEETKLSPVWFVPLMDGVAKKL
ncbi:methyltransferase domain-containing protein [Rhodobacteraceae bacterium RKSG542]|uniref:protein-L-isoaspartate O-methyltransferase family protein n=1 Tax=Pseudovibrio flavus TaxID=2529854 RepID=UPI0012BCF704|nr:rRNA adenine N-6-methyltransferase family protein [Pseudovibrio flavus]MTI15866.1 methyltransferase domain-containing protein [Pseudovibrio flavus]